MNLYDSVLYPTFVQEQTHPDRMYVVGSMFGMAPVPIEQCRVLEVGCGDGNNILPVAYCCPKAEFVGVDLAEVPIAAGNEAIEQIGLENVVLRVGDLTALPANLGKFDYIIAHGIYSWVPKEVREGLLRTCREHLSERGIAYVSYNTLPGGHARRIVRDLMLFHTRGITDPEEKVKGAEWILETAAEATPREDYFGRLLADRKKRIASGTALFHDDLNEVYEPFYFEEFMSQAGQHGLAYVGEADFFEMNDAIYPMQMREKLQELSRGDRVHKEQYMDFLSGRGFRQTLLCHEGVQIDAAPKAERIRPLHVSTTMATTDKEGEFVTKGGRKTKTNHPVMVKKLAELCEIWPASVPVESVTGGDPLLENYLFQLYASNFVQLHSHAPYFTLHPGEHPEASAVARYQAIQGEFVATLAMHAVQVEGETARKFLLKLDGTRSRKELAEEMDRPLEMIEENLKAMTRMGLMVR